MPSKLVEDPQQSRFHRLTKLQSTQQNLPQLQTGQIQNLTFTLQKAPQAAAVKLQPLYLDLFQQMNPDSAHHPPSSTMTNTTNTASISTLTAKKPQALKNNHYLQSMIKKKMLKVVNESDKQGTDGEQGSSRSNSLQRNQRFQINTQLSNYQPNPNNSAGSPATDQLTPAESMIGQLTTSERSSSLKRGFTSKPTPIYIEQNTSSSSPYSLKKQNQDEYLSKASLYTLIPREDIYRKKAQISTKATFSNTQSKFFQYQHNNIMKHNNPYAASATHHGKRETSPYEASAMTLKQEELLNQKKYLQKFKKNQEETRQLIEVHQRLNSLSNLNNPVFSSNASVQKDDITRNVPLLQPSIPTSLANTQYGKFKINSGSPKFIPQIKDFHRTEINKQQKPIIKGAQNTAGQNIPFLNQQWTHSIKGKEPQPTVEPTRQNINHQQVLIGQSIPNMKQSFFDDAHLSHTLQPQFQSAILQEKKLRKIVIAQSRNHQDSAGMNTLTGDGGVFSMPKLLNTTQSPNMHFQTSPNDFHTSSSGSGVIGGLHTTTIQIQTASPFLHMTITTNNSPTLTQPQQQQQQQQQQQTTTSASQAKHFTTTTTTNPGVRLPPPHFDQTGVGAMPNSGNHTTIISNNSNINIQQRFEMVKHNRNQRGNGGGRNFNKAGRQQQLNHNTFI